MDYKYGEKINFSDKRPISLPDFIIAFNGERLVKSSIYPHGFRYLDFDLQRAKTRKLISWTSGTGDIAPINFNFEGNGFILEIGMSAFLRLEPGELVIWEEAEFKRREEETGGRKNR